VQVPFEELRHGPSDILEQQMRPGYRGDSVSVVHLQTRPGGVARPSSREAPDADRDGRLDDRGGDVNRASRRYRFGLDNVDGE